MKYYPGLLSAIVPVLIGLSIHPVLAAQNKGQAAQCPCPQAMRSGDKMTMAQMTAMMRRCPMCKDMVGKGGMSNQQMMKMMQACPACKAMMGKGMMGKGMMKGPGKKGMSGMNKKGMSGMNMKEMPGMDAQGLTGRAGDLVARLQTSPSPPRPGKTTFTASVKTATGAPVTGAAVTLRLSMPSMKMEGPTATLNDKGHGIYSGIAAVGMAGGWQAEISVSRPGKAPLKLQFPFTAR